MFNETELRSTQLEFDYISPCISSFFLFLCDIRLQLFLKHSYIIYIFLTLCILCFLYLLSVSFSLFRNFSYLLMRRAFYTKHLEIFFSLIELQLFVNCNNRVDFNTFFSIIDIDFFSTTVGINPQLE